MEYISKSLGFIIKYGIGILGLLFSLCVSIATLQGIILLTIGMIKKDNRDLVGRKWFLFMLIALVATITIYCGVCNILHSCFGFKDLPLTRLPSRYSW